METEQMPFDPVPVKNAQEMNTDGSKPADTENKVNPAAEAVAAKIANAILIIGLLFTAVCLIGGIALIENCWEEIGGPMLCFVPVILIVVLSRWASIKIMVNISRNLYSIKDKLNK